jgi:tetratricopeptide (TPR) repeat protein
MKASFTSRLRDLVGIASQDAPARTDSWPATRPIQFAGGTQADSRALKRITATLDGEVRQLEGGACIVVDRWYAPEQFHGQFRIGDCANLLQRHRAHARVLGGDRAHGSPEGPSPIFFDLETTGLAGGAGTYAFLVGCAEFVDGAFRTRQYFLTGYGAEGPLLSAVGECMAGADLLVSFNGRTFDAPLLETRYLFHRTSMPFADVPHLDLLHTARRLWNGEDGCSLRLIENAQAGVTRSGDVPSAEIPARYIQYVRTGEARPLVPVFEHNRLDLLSLAVLTAAAMALVEQGATATRSASECLGLGRLYERAGFDAQAMRCYEHAASDDAGGAPDVRAEALRRLARSLRRARRHEEAADAWSDLLVLALSDDGLNREAARALAVHHEHRSRNLEAARLFAVKAAAAATTEAHRASARHRLGRLERKLEHSWALDYGLWTLGLGAGPKPRTQSLKPKPEA